MLCTYMSKGAIENDPSAELGLFLVTRFLQFISSLQIKNELSNLTFCLDLQITEQWLYSSVILVTSLVTFVISKAD